MRGALHQGDLVGVAAQLEEPVAEPVQLVLGFLNVSEVRQHHQKTVGGGNGQVGLPGDRADIHGPVPVGQKLQNFEAALDRCVGVCGHGALFRPLSSRLHRGSLA